VIYTHVAAALLGFTVAAIGAWQVQDWRFNARIAQMEQAHSMSLKAITDDALSRQKAALAKLQDLNAVRQKVEEDYALEKGKAAVAARSARAELDGLRQELYALSAPARQPTSTTSGIDAAPIERKLFGECATALVEMAERTVSLATQLVGLQNYVRDVCSAPAR